MTPIEVLKNTLKSYRRKSRRRAAEKALPLRGFEPSSEAIDYLDRLTDTELAQLNQILNWNAFVVDSQGRRFGSAAWEGKRTEPQLVPDPRIKQLHDRLDLSNKHVLEVGCFEGIHTAGLLRFAKSATAVDSRLENVVKTIVRCAFFGYRPTVFVCNVEDPIDTSLLEADVLHHVGVLYHLKDPVAHLIDIAQFIRVGMLLDTHYCLEDEATETYESRGVKYRYKRFTESGASDVFSGMYDHSKWLTLDSISGILREAGFTNTEVLETRVERNGPRVMLIVRR